MQFGWLKTATKQGPTKAEHIQQLLDAMYVNASSSPIFTGGAVTGRTDLSYGYSRGVGLVKTAAGAGVVGWETNTTSLVPQPSVDRVDVIYANADGVFVAPGGVGLPAAAIILGRRRLPAGSTNTSRSVSVHDKNYALPYGSNLGYLAETWNRSYGSAGLVPTGWTRAATLTFTVPTDRIIDVVVRQGIASNPVGFATTDMRWMGLGSMQWAADLDGSLMESWDMPFDRRWLAQLGGIHGWRIPAGQHTIAVNRRVSMGPEYNPTFFMATETKGFVGEWIAIRDMGVAE